MGGLTSALEDVLAGINYAQIDQDLLFANLRERYDYGGTTKRSSGSENQKCHDLLGAHIVRGHVIFRRLDPGIAENRQERSNMAGPLALE